MSHSVDARLRHERAAALKAEDQRKNDACRAAIEGLQAELKLREAADPTVKFLISAKFCEGAPTALDALEHILQMQRQALPLALVHFEVRPVDEIPGVSLFAAVATTPVPAPPAPATPAANAP